SHAPSREMARSPVWVQGDPAPLSPHNNRRDRDATVGHLDRAALSCVSQRLRDTLFDGAPSRVHVELHFAAEKAIGVQTPEDEIGVGDSWLDSTSTIGNRHRRGAGALRTDMAALLRIEPRDGAAARAHFD